MRLKRVSRFLVAAVLLLSAAPLPGSAAASHDITSTPLPDLAMAPPSDFSVQHRPAGGRWLRFSTTVVNIGHGPFDIYGYEPANQSIVPESFLSVRQRLTDGGDWIEHDVPATMSYSGDGHDHWHVHGLQLYELSFEATPAETIEEGAKTGFCFYDTDDYLGTHPRHYYPGSVDVCEVGVDGRVPMGLSIGWGDEYPATISGQYVDITGLPYGTYWLSVTADPNGEFVEARTDNNVHRSKVRIERSNVTVLYQDPAPGTDTTPPGAPDNLVAVGGDTTVSLDWNDNSQEQGVAQYRVYRKEGTSWALDGATTTSSYTDGGLTNDIEYCYQVTAVDSSGNESSASEEACATPGAGTVSVTVHVGDLDGVPRSDGRYWYATVTVTVHDGADAAVSNAHVSGSWTAGVPADVGCTTDGNGICTVSSGKLPKSTGSLALSIVSVSEAGEYEASLNHDPDADSDGTTIVIAKP